MSLPISSMASNNKPLPMVRIGYVEFPPVASTNEQGKAEGTVIDILDKVLRHAGYNYSTTSYPTKRITSYLTTGKIDLWLGISSNPAFRDTTLVGDSEVYKITMQSYVIGNKPPVKVKQDLNNKTVIVMRGYSYGGWIDYIKDPANDISYIETNSHRSALMLLKVGRGDYLLDYKITVDHALQNLDINNIVATKLAEIPSYFVVSKHFPNAKKLLSDLEKSYKQLIGIGTLKQE